MGMDVQRNKQTKRRAGKAAGAGDTAAKVGDEPAPTQASGSVLPT